LETTENEVRDAFAAHGTVTEANLIMDRMTNRSRGFAFVTMSTDEEAQKAIQALNGKDMGGRALARGGGRRDYGGGGGGGRRY
jgi:RNA recognition motif-containing protein